MVWMKFSLNLSADRHFYQADQTSRHDINCKCVLNRLSVLNSVRLRDINFTNILTNFDDGGTQDRLKITHGIQCSCCGHTVAHFVSWARKRAGHKMNVVFPCCADWETFVADTKCF